MPIDSNVECGGRHFRITFNTLEPDSGSSLSPHTMPEQHTASTSYRDPKGQDDDDDDDLDDLDGELQRKLTLL